jgi:hypothetical protein
MREEPSAHQRKEKTMAEKKPVYNPPAADGAKAASAKQPTSRDASAVSSTQRKLGVGAIIGISAAGLALLLGTSVAGAAIVHAAADNDRGHVRQDGQGGMPGAGDRDNRNGGHDGDRGAQGGKGDKMGPQMDDGMPQQMPGGGMPNGEMPNDQMNPDPYATAPTK